MIDLPFYLLKHFLSKFHWPEDTQGSEFTITLTHFLILAIILITVKILLNYLTSTSSYSSSSSSSSLSPPGTQSNKYE